MKTAEWRIEMRLEPSGRELMRFLMKREGLTIVQLAQRCGTEKHKSSIGHLLSGKRTSCGDDLAIKIERELLGKGMGELRLFTPRVSRVAQDGKTKRTAA